jgi:8-oxo-dGTP pyrophosphatase MutT (NUDIX family)
MNLHAEAVKALEGWAAPDDAQQTLRDLYLAHLLAYPDGLSRSCRPGHITASAAILDSGGGHVLLTLHSKIGRWLQLGGHCEPADPTLAAAALREATEESGVPGLVMLPGPVNLDRHAVRCGDDAGDAGREGNGAAPGSRTTWHLDVQYAAIAPRGARAVCGAESDALRWWPVDSLPAGADGSVRRLVDRARAAIG